MNFQDFFERIMAFESENINKFMKIKIGEIHLYPIFRYSILLEILKNTIKIQEPHASSRQNKSWPFELTKSFVRNCMRNAKIVRNINMVDVIAISTFGLRRKKVDNKEFDVIYDYFLPEITDNYLLIEQHFRFKNSKNPYTRNVYYNLPQLVTSRINLIGKRYDREQKKILRNFSLLVSESINNSFGNDYSISSQRFQNIFKRFKYIYNYSLRIANFIKSFSPKLLFVHCGSYGGPLAIIIKICKSYGIKIAEVQHGVVNKFHLAYNYGFKSSEYKKYLPDFFLSWGKYWSNQLKRLPINKVVVGNPEFIDNLMKFSEKNSRSLSSPDTKLILIVSQGIATNRLVKLAKNLSTKLPDDYKIIYKLHPGEVPFKDRYQSLYSYKNITVVKFGNIYEYIKKSDFIIGYTSTTLFEALPFEKSIFILDDQLSRLYIPNEIGIRFKNADELKEVILNPEKLKYNSVDWKYYWETDWRNNLKSFIQNLS